MNGFRTPRFETRRRVDLRNELIARARAWLPEWHYQEGAPDFAAALFDIAARLESEVAQRLDKIPEKTFRGFLYWLGVRGRAAQAGRLPLVFGLAAGSDPVLASAPVQVQATPPQADSSVSPEPVTFETENSILLVPGTLASVVGADPANDKFFLPGGSLSPMDASKPGPSYWVVKTDAPVGATQVQLEPALGLDALPTLLHETTGLQYRVTAVQAGLATIEPPVGTPQPGMDANAAIADGLVAGSHLITSLSFDPFGAAERNRQEHALYLGSESIFNLPTAATVRLSGLDAVDASWSYWGKAPGKTDSDWQPLTPVKGESELTLSKPAGSVDIRNIGDKSSRWLRGTPNEAVGDVLQISQVTLGVNCPGKASPPKCPAAAGAKSPVAVEGIANTTPLVLDSAFYPLGREPRLFDAFYIGSPEVFSKKNASVTICLEALDGTTQALTAARVGAVADFMFFGVGADGNLHRKHQESTPSTPVTRLPAVRPPFNDAGVAAVNTAPVALNRSQPRLTTLSRYNDVLVPVTAGNDVWVWSENLNRGFNQWYSLGSIPAPPLPPIKSIPPSVMIMSDGANLRVVALRDEQLWETVLPAGWQSGVAPTWTAVPQPAVTRHWQGIAPVFKKNTPLTGAAFEDGWAAFDDVGIGLFMPDGGNSKFQKKLPIGAISPTVTPLLIRLDPDKLLVAAQKTPGMIRSWLVAAMTKVLATVDGDVFGQSFDWFPGAPDDIAVIFARQSVDTPGGDVVAWFPWAQPAASVADKSALYRSQPLPHLNGAPGVTAGYVVAPGVNDEIVAMPFQVGGLVRSDVDEDTVASALVFDNPTRPPALDDFIETTLDGQAPALEPITKVNTNGTRKWLQIPDSKRGATVDSARVYRRLIARNFVGKVETVSGTDSTIKAELHDTNADTSFKLIVNRAGALSVHNITNVVPDAVAEWTITVSPAIPGAAPLEPIKYGYVATITSPSAILPLLLLQPANAFPAAQIPALVANGAYFRGGDPIPNPLLFLQGPAAALEAAVLEKPWTVWPAAAASKFIISTTTLFDTAITLADPKSANPALSWEYFDGQAWWKIKGLVDQTSNLRSTGIVSFSVPAGLQPTDVAGRKSYWIRARLVGGDYGQETVTLKSKPDPSDPTATIQTVQRSLAGVTPPLLGSVDLRYSVCCAATPDYVITQDSGATRDQTAANELDAAKVEVFTSLSVSLSRLELTSQGSADDGGLAIYLGCDAPLSGGPISILFLVEEGNFDDAFPLRVDVLREQGFEPIVAQDGTRGLNESGVLTFNLSGPPPAVALFGPDARYWLRLRPSATIVNNWQPRIRAAYLNATYARAAETQQLERLGSSDGSPGQSVFLARPPILEGTLELRAREPLGDEDIQALMQADPASVLDVLPNGQAGPWVLWTLVDDTNDGSVNDRIYSLDYDTGEIKFGDGLHGRIPPIGRDSIVAMRYKRGGGAAANQVTAWSQLNLISAVPGVEKVIAPEGAAGGSDPQTADEVMQFASVNQFMRDRALTLHDFESLALQSSRDVAQVRASTSGAGVRLIVVIRGRNPEPTQAQQRELLRYLAARTSPILAARGAITIVPPRLVEIRVKLKLTVLSIEDSGTVARDVSEKITDLLDPASGGLDGMGWQLSEMPTVTDIAAAIDDLENLEEIDSVEITATADGQAVTVLQPADLVVPAAEGIQMEFQASDVGPIA